MEKYQEKEDRSVLTQGIINEEEALRELKEKTAQFLRETKAETAEKQAEQISNFEEKIKVSRKIREIVANSTNRTQLSIILEEAESNKKASK